jgi:muramidase (phage lysozyme)
MNPNAMRAAELLLDFIGKTETGREGIEAYNTVYGHKEGKLGKALTDFTIDELLAAQRTWGKNWGSSAAGKFQIIRKTLAGLVAQTGLAGTAKFSKNTQDMLGYQLLKGRGFEQFAAGTLPLKDFALNLSKEWASFPVLATTQGASRQVTRGMSFYAGDGLNKALVSPGDVESLLSEALNLMSKPVPAPTPSDPPRPVPKPVPVDPAPPAAVKRGKLGWWLLGVVIIAALIFAAFTVRF